MNENEKRHRNNLRTETHILNYVCVGKKKKKTQITNPITTIYTDSSCPDVFVPLYLAPVHACVTFTTVWLRDAVQGSRRRYEIIYLDAKNRVVCWLKLFFENIVLFSICAAHIRAQYVVVAWQQSTTTEFYAILSSVSRPIRLARAKTMKLGNLQNVRQEVTRTHTHTR